MAPQSCTSVWSSVIFASFMALTAGFLSILQWMHIEFNGTDIDEITNFFWYMSILLPIGGLFGSIISGFLAHKYGRKNTILLLGIIFTLALLLFAVFEWSWNGLRAAQFFVGFAIGGILVVLPIYVVEIAESRNRGRLAAMIHFFFSVGVLTRTVLNQGEVRNLVHFILCFIFLGISLAIIFFLTQETPQFLILNKQDEQAKKSLQNLRSTLQVDGEYWEIKNLALASSDKAILHTVALLLFRVLSGTEMILFESSIMTRWSEEYYSYNMFMIFVPLIASILAICLMDTIGRRTILGVSTIGTAIAQIILVINFEQYLEQNWLILLCITTLTIFYSVGIATLPIIVATELQVNSSKRPLVLGTAAAISWFIIFVKQGFFFDIVLTLGVSVFWFFPVINAIAGAYYVIFLPETMKKSPKEICDSFRR